MNRPASQEASRAALLARAREVGDWLLAQAARIEAAGRVPDDVAQRLADADLLHITVPRRAGGLGLGLDAAWQATFEVARGCGSCAWLVGLGSANLLMLSRFGATAQRAVLADTRGVILPMLTGGVGEDVVVAPEGDGLRVSGRWRYASGIDVAPWVGLLVNRPLPGGATEPVVVLVEQRAFQIDHDSWRVLGMRGTGSKRVTLDRAFVPAAHAMRWELLQAGGRDPACGHDEAWLGIPLNAAFAMSVLAPTLGVAAATVDEFADLVRTRVSSGTREQALDDKFTHVTLASARAVVDSACLSLLHEARALHAAVVAGEPPGPLQRAALRMRIAQSSRQALSACQALHAHLGGTLLASGTRIERQFRDLHAMSSHFLLQPQPIGEAYGRLLLGLPLPPHARF